MEILCKNSVPIVFGSDAHKPEDVGRGFSEAVRLAKEVGYTHACIFSNRRREFVKI
ncbi:MAG: PHP-associated domain-containing protein [Candidatus Bathyarchaeia archaeon]